MRYLPSFYLPPSNVKLQLFVTIFHWECNLVLRDQFGTALDGRKRVVQYTFLLLMLFEAFRLISFNDIPLIFTLWDPTGTNDFTVRGKYVLL